MSLCTKCGAEHSRRGQRRCAPCHAAYMREWRKGRPLTEQQRKRDIARSVAGVDKRDGRINSAPCQCCGSPESQMHHPDHELPRLVVWLCRPCHLAWHSHWREVAHQTWQRWLADQTRRSTGNIRVSPDDTTEAA